MRSIQQKRKKSSFIFFRSFQKDFQEAVFDRFSFSMSGGAGAK